MARKRTSVAFIAGKQSRDVTNDRHCAVDAHGDIDLYSEFGWQNVKIVIEKNLKQVQGVNLNCLLRALFILYGYENISDSTLPGGFYCWEVLLESFFVSITHLCSVEDIIRRIHHLIDIYLKGDGTEGSADGENYAIGNVLYGAFSFLMFWIQAFHAYMADTHLTKLKSGIIGLGQKLNSPTEEAINMRNKYSYNYTEVLERLRGRYEELRTAAHHVTQCRLLNTIGLTRQLTSPQDGRYGGHGLGGKGKDYRTVTFVHQSYMQPNVRASTAAWTGFEAQRKKEELKKTLAAAPQVKLEIFGGEALLDASDDEDDDAPASALRGTGKRGKGAFFGSDEEEEGPPSPPPPVVRVDPSSFSLLQEPYALSLDLFSLDPLELARQWTLADHALFCNIALHSLLPPAGTNTSISSLSRSQQAKLGILGTGVFGGCRAFIDRFNALSAWVTSSILQQAELGARAERVTFFIRVGGHLAELANFNGLMVVVTALQQGCVTRLKWTFEQVPKAERAKLGQLQRVMEGSKNYQRYRVEVAKLAPHFYLGSVGRGRGGGGISVGLEEFSDVDWKREVVRRYKADLSVLRSPNPRLSSSRDPTEGEGEGEGYSAPRLMRTASVNGMMLAKAHSLDHSEPPWSASFQAMVPHMGAHLAELTSITEGNGDYLVDRPYLFSTHKLALLAGTLSMLHKMQQLRYNLTPVRAIIAALNFTAKRHVKLTPAGASEQAKQLFALSHAVEPAGMAPPGAEVSDRASSVGGGGSAAGGRGSATGAGVGARAGAGRGNKARSGSQAYLRITGKIAEEEEGDSEEEGSGESEGDEEDEGQSSKPKPRRLLSRPFKLIRTFTSAFMSSAGNSSNK